MQRLPKWTRPLVQTAIGATASYGVGVTSVAVGRHLTNSPVIVIAAGGSGGHVLPAVAVAEQLDKDLQDWQNHQVVLFGQGQGLESEASHSLGLIFYDIPCGILHKPYRTATNVWEKTLNVLGILKSAAILVWLTPQAVLGTGGHVIFPTCVAAKALGIPVVLFEPNASVGLTNRTLQPIADALLLGWPSSRNARQVIGNGRRSAEFVGMPLRGQLLRMIGKGQRERAQLHAAAKQRLGIPWRRSTTSLSGIAASSCSSQPAFGSSSSTSQGRFSKDLSVEQRGGGGGGRVHGWLSRVRGRRSRLVVVLGGALGCRNLNFIMHQALPQLLSVRGTHVLWQTGQQQFEAYQRYAPVDNPRLHMVPWVEDMAGTLAAADLVVCRAGGATCAELRAAAAPALLLPAPPGAEDDQLATAAALQPSGFTEVLLQSELTPAALAARVNGLLADKQRLHRMQQAAGMAADTGTDVHAAERVSQQVLRHFVCTRPLVRTTIV